MINPIKIFAGELIEDMTGDVALVMSLEWRSGYILYSNPSHGTKIYLYNLKNNDIFKKEIYFEDLKEYKRFGSIIKTEKMFDGEDMLCHYCAPSSIGGCIDCFYNQRIKTRKKFFNLGDKVFDPVFKTTHHIIKILLGIKIEKDYYVFNGEDGWSARKFYEYYFEQSKVDPEVDHVYVLSGFSRKTYFTAEELRLVKRYSYLLDQKQFKYICSELCLYGLNSKNCDGCITNNLMTDLLKNDLSRDCRKI